MYRESIDSPPKDKPGEPKTSQDVDRAVPPLYSILLPVYNGERYLRFSIESVLAQSLGDLELVICDDASSDASVAIINDYRDQRIRFIANETNRGLFDTLNRLVATSRGTYLRFWAQDDIMKPHCLETEHEFWERHPEIELLYCAVEVVTEPGSVISPLGTDDTPEIVPPWLSDQISFYHGCMQGNISTVSVRRRTLASVGPFRSMKFAGDFEMWLRISSACTIGFLRAPVVTLRSHAGQLSRQLLEWRTYVRETRPIFSSLFDRLPPSIQPHAYSFERRHRGVGHIQYVVRLILSGRFSEAREVWQELTRSDQPFELFLLWAGTLNGRLFRPSPVYVDPAQRREAIPPR